MSPRGLLYFQLKYKNTSNFECSPENSCYVRNHQFLNLCAGSVLSAKSRSDQQLSEARLKARTIVHAFHKAQDKMDALEVS